MKQALKQEKEGEGERGEIYCASKRIKYVLTAFWPEGSNAEIVTSGCQARVALFTREQTFPNPGEEHITQCFSQLIM